MKKSINFKQVWFYRVGPISLILFILSIILLLKTDYFDSLVSLLMMITFIVIIIYIVSYPLLFIKKSKKQCKLWKQLLISTLIILIFAVLPLSSLVGFAKYILPGSPLLLIFLYRLEGSSYALFYSNLILFFANFLIINGFLLGLYFLKVTTFYQKINWKIVLYSGSIGLILNFFLFLCMMITPLEKFVIPLLFMHERFLILVSQIYSSSLIVALMAHTFLFFIFPLIGLIIGLIITVSYSYRKVILKLNPFKKLLLLFYLICLISMILITSVNAYDMSIGKETHQHMTKEAGKIWKQVPCQRGFNKE